MILGLDPIYIILAVMVGVAGLLGYFLLCMRRMLGSLGYLSKMHGELIGIRQTTSGSLPRLTPNSLNKTKLSDVQAILTSLMGIDAEARPRDAYTAAMRLSAEVGALKQEAANRLARFQHGETESVPAYTGQPMREYRTPTGQVVQVYEQPTRQNTPIYPQQYQAYVDPRVLSAVDSRA